MHYQSTPYRSKIVQTQRIQFNLVSLSSHVYINITSTQSIENFQKFGSESREEGAEGQTYPHESRKTWIRFQEARLFSPLPPSPLVRGVARCCRTALGSSAQEGHSRRVGCRDRGVFFYLSARRRRYRSAADRRNERTEDKGGG